MSSNTMATRLLQKPTVSSSSSVPATPTLLTKTPQGILSNQAPSLEASTPSPAGSPGTRFYAARERLAVLESESGDILGQIWRMKLIKSRKEETLQWRSSITYLLLLLAASAWLFGSAVSWGSPAAYLAASLEYVVKCVKLDGSIDPRELAVFNSLGLWPVIGLAFNWQDKRARPFCLAAFATGCFAYLPYMILFRLTPPTKRGKGVERSPWVALVALFLALSLVMFGIFFGRPLDQYRARMAAEPFVHVMTVDFFVFCLLSAEWIRTDLGFDAAPKHWTAAACFPLVGPCIYLLLNSRDTVSTWPESPRPEKSKAQ